MSSIPAEMSQPAETRLDLWAAAWRGPLLSALLVLLTAVPGLIALPPLDRDESRFAQATAQMLETNDFVNIRYQSEPRDKKPVGIHWLQAASVSALSSVEKRQIWAYRIPSLLGMMIAAAACAWGAAAWFGPRGGLFAGLVMGGALVISSEAFIAKTDAVQCGAITLAMAALGRLYQAAREDRVLSFWPKLMFWAGMAVSILIKGPIGPMVAGLTLVTLGAWDRRWRWIGRIGWIWGLLLVLAVVGPWAIAITVETDGRFWTGAVGGDLAPKLKGGHESHGAPPGVHALLTPLLLFPATAVLPAALVVAWRRRLEPGVRFAVAWLAPSWLVFELAPTKLWHYTEPLYGALAWLAAAALTAALVAPWGPWVRRIGAVLSLLAGALLAVAAIYLAGRYGGGGSPWAWMSSALALATGAVGAVAVMRPVPWRLGGVALGLGVLTHVALTGGLAPTLRDLWLSRNAAALLAASNLDPRNGVTQGPVAVVGYGEPSLVFLLGTETELDDPSEGADALAAGEPVLVEARQQTAFQQALKGDGARAALVGEVKGFDYSIGKPLDLKLYRSAAPATPPVSGAVRPGT